MKQKYGQINRKTTISIEDKCPVYQRVVTQLSTMIFEITFYSENTDLFR